MMVITWSVFHSVSVLLSALILELIKMSPWEKQNEIRNEREKEQKSTNDNQILTMRLFLNIIFCQWCDFVSVVIWAQQSSVDLISSVALLSLCIFGWTLRHILAAWFCFSCAQKTLCLIAVWMYLFFSAQFYRLLRVRKRNSHIQSH